MGRPGRPVVTPLGRFESAVKAALAHGLSPSLGHARASRQIDGWRFEDERPRFRRKWAIAVTTPEGRFPTVSAAARHHHICCATVEARIRRGEEGWDYVDRTSPRPPMPPPGQVHQIATDRPSPPTPVA